MSDTTSEVAATPSLESQMLASLEKVSPESAIPESITDNGSGAITPVDATDEQGVVDSEESAEDTATESDDSDKATDESEHAEKEDAPDPVDEEFAEAMKKRGITTDLSDVPKELRAVLFQKVKAMDAGYTKVRQEAAAYRSEKAAFEAEKSYIEKNTDQHVADLLDKDPDLIDKVNAELERRKDPTYTKALAKERETAKREAAVQVKEREYQEQQELARQVEADRLDTYVEHTAKAAGLPLELVEDAITLLTEQLRDKEDRLPTEAELYGLVQRHAKIYKKHVGAQKGATARQKTREYLDSKRQDKADASGASKPSGQATATVGLPAKKPASVEEGINATLDRLGMVA